ncbi:HAD-IIA family hydrolase [Aeromicrobium sp.]|uniref:HAD-IIA family hydrolase n=1 Tax=Aeromicrobium sp. TaxID=1871063 RepID=UPI003D6ABF97
MSLGSSDRPLCEAYGLGLLDLDGVVYVGDEAVPGAVEALSTARGAGMNLAFLTNNASRTAGDVAAHLRELEIEADDADVVTAAEAVAHLVSDAVPVGSPVLLIGGEGLRVPLEERGLRCVTSLDDHPVAVVQGFHPDLGWRSLAEAAYAIESGLPWFASNIDMTIPTARGIAPGNGSLVQAVRNATGATPMVAGKPERALFDEALERMAAERPLMVGDRLDTDIDGAINAGLDSLAVLSGVNTLQDVMGLVASRRPTFVARDLSALVTAHPDVIVDGMTAECGAATAHAEGAVIGLGQGEPGSLEAIRAVVTLAWSLFDRYGRGVRLDGTLES